MKFFDRGFRSNLEYLQEAGGYEDLPDDETLFNNILSHKEFGTIRKIPYEQGKKMGVRMLKSAREKIRYRYKGKQLKIKNKELHEVARGREVEPADFTNTSVGYRLPDDKLMYDNLVEHPEYFYSEYKIPEYEEGLGKLLNRKAYKRIMAMHSRRNDPEGRDKELATLKQIVNDGILVRTIKK